MEKHFIEIKNNNERISSLVLYTVELRSRKFAMIEEVKTVDKYRNQGYATELIEIAKIKAQELNCDTIELCFNSKDKVAEKLYNKSGFMPDGNIKMCIILNNDIKQKDRW